MYMAIDALTWTIINPLLKNGKLPNIEKLIKSGVSSTLTSEHPLLSPIIWTSIFSGQKASKHGVTSFFDWYDDVKCLRIWDILNFLRTEGTIKFWDPKCHTCIIIIQL